MKGKRKTAESCILPENLSAALDGEYHFSENEKKHLEKCSRCKTLYESYKIIDDAASGALDVPFPDQTAKRIRKQVHAAVGLKLVDQEAKPIRFWTWTARIAAALVLFGLVGYFVFQGQKSPNKAPADLYADAPLAAPGTSAELSPAPAPYSGFSGAVDIRELQPVALGENKSTFEFMKKEEAQKNHSTSVVLIPSKLKHVWLYKKGMPSSGIENIFRKALLQTGIPLKEVKIAIDSEGVLRAQLELTRYQSVRLVNMLHKQNLRLISPDQPQPEQKYFSGTGHELLDYEIVLMPDKQ